MTLPPAQSEPLYDRCLVIRDQCVVFVGVVRESDCLFVVCVLVIPN